MSRLGLSARHGVVAAGVTDGRRWQVRMSGPPGNPTMIPSGLPMMAQATGPAPVGWPASFEADSGSGRRGYAAIAGTVTDRVTRLDISLPDGELVSLTPVKWAGHRWVAVVLPPDVRIVRAVAYAGARELAYAVPFGTVDLATWWRPGQVPPQRLTKLIGAGRTNGIAWYYKAEFGPWGYCYTSRNTSECFDPAANAQIVPTRVISGMACGPLTGDDPHMDAISGLVAAASSVRKVVLKYSDGSTASFPATEVDGYWVVSFGIPAHLSVVHSVEYGASGQVVGSTAGATWEC